MEKIYLNNNWGFTEVFTGELCSEFFNSPLENVRLPHTNKMTPYNYFDESCYQMICGYRKALKAEAGWKGKHVILTFEGAAHATYVYVNGHEVVRHYCGYTAFSVDIEPYLYYDKENIIAVKLDSYETLNVPPFGNVIDYMTYGGMYREVYLEIKNKVYIKDVFVTTTEVTNKEKVLHTEITLNQREEDISVKQSLIKIQKLKMEDDSFKIELGEDRITESSIKLLKKVRSVELWDIDNPVLYLLKVELIKDGEMIDCYTVKIGFRETEFKKEGFYLNGKKIKLRGLNRHQSYPYVGYAMPKSPQQRDAHILKYELGANAVRTSHYPQSQYFIDKCDEIGLLVFTEIPGWQYIGDEKWKEIAYQNVEEMVLQYRNHPSIILWGVRINESQDDDVFYKRTNEIAHQLDPSRSTGGVRFLKKSHLLEDVYTYNDFLHNGKTKGLDKKNKVTSNLGAAYLVSEYNGHMFPTKSFDSEEHRLENALRHTCILDALYENEDISGAFAWCMFDYNTHKDFGSGDRICYHGVMDMFRNPKLAAAIYQSQSDEMNVCEISSSMDIGEHPGGNIGMVYAFTNADSIRLYKNEEFVKEFYPSKVLYSHLPHPPIIIDDFVGCLLEKKEGFDSKTADKIKEVLFAVAKYGQNNLPFSYMIKMSKLIISKKLNLKEGMRLYYDYIGNWGGTVTTYNFEAIKDGEIVKTIRKTPVTKPIIKIISDKKILIEDTTYDVASINIKVEDEYGNILSYYQEPLVLEVSGDIEIIGPKIISLKGGMAGTYIKSIGVAGKGCLKVRNDALGGEELEYLVEIKS